MTASRQFLFSLFCLWSFSIHAAAIEGFPLRFQVVGNGVQQTGPLLDYDLESKTTLRIGDQLVNEQTVRFALGTLAEVFPKASLKSEERRERVLVAKWPLPLMREGQIEFISRAGRVLASFPVTTKAREEWSKTLREWKVPENAAVIGIRQFDRQSQRLLEYESTFHICIGTSSEKAYTRMCSVDYEFRRNQAGLQLLALPSMVINPRVILQQKTAALKALTSVPLQEPVQFFAELGAGMTYEFGAYPEPLVVTDMTQLANGKVRVVSDSELPSANYVIQNPSDEGMVSKFFGWGATIGDFRRYWQLDFERSHPTLYVTGPFGGIFRYDFQIERLPDESWRVFLESRTPNSTYVDGPSLYGKASPGVRVSSEEWEVKPYEDGEFRWTFQSQNRGEFNRSRVRLNKGDESFLAFYEMYKGYPREISARMSGILGSEGNYIINGELAFNYWFEDIFGWRNSLLSVHRWGASVKTFQSLNTLRISSRSGTLSTTTADLKYRLVPGLWGRDESWGLIAGTQDVKYDVFKATQMGVGFFWARSMPKIFDDVFNIVSYMRYPKWVDLEYIYYPTFFSKEATPIQIGSGGSGNWALNFHGKVLWSKTVFGEAGFGIKQYDWRQELTEDGTAKRLRYAFTALYGTVGLGYSF